MLDKISYVIWDISLIVIMITSIIGLIHLDDLATKFFQKRFPDEKDEKDAKDLADAKEKAIKELIEYSESEKFNDLDEKVKKDKKHKLLYLILSL